MIEIFGGTGFIGSEFYKQHDKESNIVKRDQLVVPRDSIILYLISTVDNYNVLTDPKLDINTNLIHLMDVLSANRDNNVTFNFVSSWFVYGSTELPAKETSCCKPKGFYSITKLAAEQLIESYCKTYNIKYTITRLANVIGKNDHKVSKKKNALQYLINQMIQGQDINLYYGGKVYRDFVHVLDVVSGLRFIMDNGISGEIYNLGSGTAPIEFGNIINFIHSEIKSTSKIGTMEPTDFHNIVQVKNMYLDTSKLTNLGWKPTMNPLEAIKSIL